MNSQAIQGGREYVIWNRKRMNVQEMDGRRTISGEMLHLSPFGSSAHELAFQASSTSCQLKEALPRRPMRLCQRHGVRELRYRQRLQTRPMTSSRNIGGDTSTLSVNRFSHLRGLASTAL